MAHECKHEYELSRTVEEIYDIEPKGDRSRHERSRHDRSYSRDKMTRT